MTLELKYLLTGCQKDKSVRLTYRQLGSHIGRGQPVKQTHRQADRYDSKTESQQVGKVRIAGQLKSTIVL